MARKKLIASASLSMMDLISNALAGVIILFFILAGTRFPSYPPERVCGTLVIEFSLNKSQKKISSDSIFSAVYVRYTLINNQHSACLDSLNTKTLFDTKIIQLSNCIQHLDTPRCSYDVIRKGNDSINPLPAIYTYKLTYKNNDTAKHIIILHDPLEGGWQIGLLYTDHNNILKDTQSYSAKINLKWYGINNNIDTTSKIFKMIASTSWIFSSIQFEKGEPIKGDSTALFGQSNPE